MPKGSKVLMADDDKMLLDMYKERLELAGYMVETGFNGEEILTKVRDFAPDIIMLDVMMPKMNGYETLASLKSDPLTKNIPVVMLSALMRDFNREKAVEGGAEDYLIKSEAMPSDVITKIEQVLQKYGKVAVNPTVASIPVAANLAVPVAATSMPTSAAPIIPLVPAPISAELKPPVITTPAAEVPVVTPTDNPVPMVLPTPTAKVTAQSSSGRMTLIIIVVALVVLLAVSFYYFVMLPR